MGYLIIMPKLMLKLALMLLVALQLHNVLRKKLPTICRLINKDLSFSSAGLADMVVMVVMVDMVIMVDIVVLVDMAGVVKVIHHYCGGYGPGGSDCLFLQ